ncbi:hypothetical protein F4819DRAFT_484645 [Hypoxylon fuscum]|nr:hypothetical protein F4819DRAFT_484645 [Hypoxylon fuscum]
MATPFPTAPSKRKPPARVDVNELTGEIGPAMQENKHKLGGWNDFPPRAVPRLDFTDLPITEEKLQRLPDIEKFTNQRIQDSAGVQQSMVALGGVRRGLMAQAQQDNDLLQIYKRKLAQTMDEYTARYQLEKIQELQEKVRSGHAAISLKDKEIVDIYTSFIDTKRCEDDAAARRRAAELLQNQKPAQKMSKAHRLFGSDGSI